MNITGHQKAENCLEGEFIFKYYFDMPWTDEYIKMMKALGELRYYESFPVPMFQINCPDGTIIKGLLSEKECRVIFPRSDPKTAKENFEAGFSEIPFH